MIGLGHFPSVENLQCFVAAAQHLNFGRAAQEVAITATAFGQRIRQLEEHLGAPLFARTTRRVSLTEAGLKLLPEARQLLQQAEVCRTAIYADYTPVRLSIGTRFELGQSWVVPGIVALSEVEPHWSVDLYFGSGPDILEQLTNGRVDGVITSAPVASAAWEAEFLHRENYVFCGSKRLLSKRPFDSVADANTHLLLDIHAGLPLTRYLTSAIPDMSFSGIKLCGAATSIIAFVRADKGVAVLPAYMVQEELESGEFVPIMPEVSLLNDSFRLMFRRASIHAPSLRRLAAFLRERPLA